MYTINTFFLRVSARCNLDCNYCYVFKHQDTSWKNYPPVISKEHIILFSERLKDYIKQKKLKEVNIIYHGGEPLLIGKDILLEYTDIILSILGDTVKVDFSIQTNGTLLTENFFEQCNKRNIKISISIDGPKKIHDKNRKMINGKGSFYKVLSGIKTAQNYPHLFEGVIGVIDPNSEPDDLLSFFYNSKLFHIDLLLPDSNHEFPPKYKKNYPDIYKKWLIKAFDLWFDKYQDISIRYFEYILKRLMNIPTSDDSFGFGRLDYLTIEVDGSYHTTDILKSAYENASAIGMSLEKSSIEDALNHEKVKEYNFLLSKDNLPIKCKKCKVVHICGGGSLPHRYSQINGFCNPTIYCDEIKSLILHAEHRMYDEIKEELSKSKD